MSPQPEVIPACRVALRYTSTNVPGPAAERARQVADDFASIHLHRAFTYDQDYVHLPTDFDCTETKRIWILCDFNVQAPDKQVASVPLQSWKVQYDSELKPQFREYTSHAVEHFASQYPWGGRENEWQHRRSGQQTALAMES